MLSLSQGKAAEGEHEIDALFSVVSARTPGAAVLVARNGQVVLERSYGLANLSSGAPITRTTRFRIGSVSKQFTAAAVLKLAEEKRLRLDDPIIRFFPEWPRGDEITVRHLLQHASGIHDFTRDAGFATGVIRPVARADLIQIIRQAPLDFIPGRKFRYSNSGYTLLGEIIERVTGVGYEEYLHRTFFEPLGMNQTGIYPSQPADPCDALGYAFERDAYREAANWHPSWLVGAGGLCSTPHDLFRWNEALYGGKVLTPASLQVAFTVGVLTDDDPDKPETTGYGSGWFIDRLRGERELSHGGEMAGFGSYLLRLPDHSLTVVVLLNCVPQMPSLQQWNLAREIAARVLRLPPLVTPESYPVLASDLAVIEGRYELDDGALMDVRVAGGRAYFAINGRTKREMRPISDRQFVVGQGEAEATFVRNPGGAVVKAILRQKGQRIDAPRVRSDGAPR
ncbi:MAG: serine hydrolase [Opitutaceae bacterium]|nr:serine hydrolase [Opitutaceae bacterium]